MVEGWGREGARGGQRGPEGVRGGEGGKRDDRGERGGERVEGARGVARGWQKGGEWWQESAIGGKRGKKGQEGASGITLTLALKKPYQIEDMSNNRFHRIGSLHHVLLN